MTWNHRVMRRTYTSTIGGIVNTEVVDEIYEVYYREDGTVDGWTENPVCPRYYLDIDDQQASIRDDVMRFLRACDMPTLDYETGKVIE